MRLLCLMMVVCSAVAMPQSTSRAQKLRHLLAQPSADSRLISDTILEAIEGIIDDFRETMLKGSEDIPVLDPLEIEHVFVNDEIVPFPGTEVTLKNMTVRNLATFVVDDLTVTHVAIILQRYRIVFDGNVPDIDVNVGHYDMTVNAMGFTLWGRGDVQLNVIKPRIQLNLLIAPRITINGIFLNLIECDIKFSLGALKAQITGMFDDEGVSTFISLFLQNLAREMLDFYEDDINKFLSEAVHEYANEFLRDFDITQIMG